METQEKISQKIDVRQDVAKKQSGFTLIELSIVLVIIGLIVGGVLVGQDLIKAAEIRSTIAQYEKYNSAVNTFRTKFGGIPGDLLGSNAMAFGLPTLSSTGTLTAPTGTIGGTALGDGNGLIESAAGAAAQIGETPLFWAQLSSSSLVDGSFGTTLVASTGAMTTAGPASFFPAAKLGKGNYWMAGSNSGQNYYLLGVVASTSATDAVLTANSGPTPIESYNIDSKIDDGMPNTGTVQVRGTATAPNTLFATLGATNTGKMTTTGATAGDCVAHTTQGTAANAYASDATYSRGAAAGNTPACALRLRFN